MHLLSTNKSHHALIIVLLQINYSDLYDILICYKQVIHYNSGESTKPDEIVDKNPYNNLYSSTDTMNTTLAPCNTETTNI